MRFIKKFSVVALAFAIGVSSFGSVSEAKTKSLSVYGESKLCDKDGKSAGKDEIFPKKYKFKTGKVTTIKCSIFTWGNEMIDSPYITIKNWSSYYGIKNSKINATYVNGKDSGSLGISKIDGGTLKIKFAKKVNGKYKSKFSINPDSDFVITVKIKPGDREVETWDESGW